MVTTQMKTDAQRLGNGKKAFNVKQVEKMLENAGGSYTAGTGIDITENVISADTEVLALKSELPDMSDYQEKLTAGDGIEINNNVISYKGKTFTKINGDDWSSIFDTTTNKTIKDCIISIYSTAIYIPKDFPSNMITINDNYNKIYIVSPATIFTSSNYIASRVTSTEYQITNGVLKIKYALADNINIPKNYYGGNIVYVGE